MHVLHTDWTIWFQRNTGVIIFVFDIDTAFAIFTMEWLFTSTTSTYSTTFTMENFFFYIVIIKKAAFITEITRKLNLTVFTILLGLLNVIALITSYFFDCESIQFMCLLYIPFIMVFNFIVTNSTWEELKTFWTFLLTTSLVMLTTILILG